MWNKARIIAISGPSGAGKSSIKDALLKDEKFSFKDVITYTTRQKRKSETDKKDYFFISEEDFKQKIEEDFFLEWVFNHGSYYGSPKKFMENSLENKQSLILDINYKGALRIKELFKEGSYSVFIKAPDKETMRQRITQRAEISEKELNSRIEELYLEMKFEKDFDLVLVNKDFETCLNEVKKNLEKLMIKQ